MNALLESLSTWMPELWRTSLQAALLVVVIVAVQWLFAKRLSPGWRHALWGLVVVRLLLVWAPASPLSVYNLAPREVPVAMVEEPEHTEIAKEAAGPVSSGDGLATTFRDLSDGRNSIEIGGMGNVVSGVDYRAAASLVWLGVFGALLLAMAGQSLHFGRQVRRGRIVTDSDKLELLEECRATLRVSPFLALVETDCVRSPALLGCVRPKLLLPCGFLDALSREEMGHVFLHELTHVKRGDIWSGWLFNLLLAAHWFNPAIWFARRRIIADREAACDAHVLAALDANGQRGYGHTVLNLTQRFNAYPWAPGMAGISETNSNLKRRITMIKQFRPPTRLAAWSGAGLCVCIGLATLTNAQDAPPAATQATESNAGIDVQRKAAEELVREGRYNDALALLDKAMKQLDKGSVEGELAFMELSALYVKYRSELLSLPAVKSATRAKGSNPESTVIENGGDIVCSASDIYGYTATNGGTMIAAQLTNTGAQDVVVDVEFWEGGIGTGTKIGRGGLVVPAGKTATEAIPWVVENGTHAISVWIDPDNAVAETDEENNRVEVSIEYTNGRFRQAASTLEDVASQAGESYPTHKLSTFADGQVPLEGEAWVVTDENGVIVERPTVLLNEDYVAGTDSGEDLKYLGIVLKMFSMESRRGVLPALSREPGRLMFGWMGDGHSYEHDAVMSVQFMTDLTYVGCKGCDVSTDVPDDSRFAYLGYILRNDDDARNFGDAYEQWASKGGSAPWFADDKPRSPDEGVARLREGIGRDYINYFNRPASDVGLADSQIPVLIEWPEHHEHNSGKLGGNVLFMDGHVEFITYPGKWPMTEETIGILCRLAGRDLIKISEYILK